MTNCQRILTFGIAGLSLCAALLSGCLSPGADNEIRGVGISTVDKMPNKDAMLAEMNRCIDRIAVETARTWTPTTELANLVQEVSGVDVNMCYQCRKCAVGCPLAYASPPRAVRSRTPGLPIGTSRAIDPTEQLPVR